MLKDMVTPDDLADPFPGRFNQGEQTHGLMIRPRPVHDGLPGQPGAQIALGSGHDPDPAHHIMVNFTSTAIDLVIHRGKIMLHVDPLTDHLRACHHDLQQPACRIFPIIIRMQKNPSLERDPPGQVTTRSEEHTSELQSLAYLVCRLLLEKKKKKTQYTI